MVKRKTPLICVSVLLVLVACGGKPRIPPQTQAGGGSRPVSPTAPRLALPKAGQPSLRILLREDFQTLRVEGATLSPLQIKVDHEWMVLFSSGRKVDEGTGFVLEPAADGLLKIDRAEFRGRIEVFINPVGKPVAVNEVPLEEYLRSVVPKELGPDSFPQLEALKAQSVAARTFAVNHLGSNARFGFDVYADSRSQVYEGRSQEHPLSDQAVLQTLSEIILYQGKPILAMYSSTCGGITAGFSDVFKGPPIEYLKGGAQCHDEASRYHRWRKEVEAREIVRRLGRFRQVGRLRSLEIRKRSSTGRVVAMSFAGERGDVLLQGNDIRGVLGLRSTFITGLLRRTDRSGYLDDVVVEGRGWGHGVGLCQIGAVDLAQRGRGYTEILTHYYSGVDIAREYGRNDP